MPRFSTGMRRHGALTVTAVIAALTCAVAPSHAQPAKADAAADRPPIRLIVPFAAGTPTDMIARTLGQGLAASLKRTVLVDNRPGAAGGIGTEAVVNAAPDGQTLLLTVNSTVTINPLLYGKLRYDPIKDLAPVAMVALGGYVLVASPQSGHKDVAGLVRAAKARPGSINYASYGTGSMSHMCGEVFQAMHGVKLFHVPYKAGSLNDILGGQVELGFEPIGPTIPHVQGGKLTALAVTTGARIEAMPGVPAMAEALPGYECTAWVGVLAPARTPPDVRSALAGAVLGIATTPKFASQMKDIGGLAAMPASAEQFTQIVRQDHDKWARVVKPLNIQLD